MLPETQAEAEARRSRFDPQESLRVMAAVARLIAETPDATCSLRQVLEMTARLFDCTLAAVYAGWPGGAIQPLTWFSPSFALEPPDAALHAERSAGVMKDGARSVGATPRGGTLAVVPVKTRGTVIGALTLETQARDAFGPSELDALETIAVQVGLAVENVIVLERISEQYYGFQAVMESVKDGLVLVEGDRVVYCNRRAADLLGVDPAEFREAGVPALHGRLAAASVKPHEVLRLFDERSESEARWGLTFLRKGNDHRHYLLEVFPVKGPDRTVLGQGYLLRDVTEQLELDRMKSDLISFVSHELATPLTTIKGVVTTLSRGDVEWAEEIRSEFLVDLLDEIERLQLLVENLTETTRLESGAWVLHPADVDVPRLLARCVARARRLYPRADIALSGTVGPGGPEPESEPLVWRLDSRAVERVVMNLIDNAVKYSGDRPEVRVAASCEKASLLIEVSDRGIGIDPADRERVFQKFYRSSSPAVLQRSGSGLGLALAAGLVAAHDGRIWVESRQGGGSTFGVLLPNAKATANAQRVRRETARVIGWRRARRVRAGRRPTGLDTDHGGAQG